MNWIWGLVIFLSAIVVVALAYFFSLGNKTEPQDASKAPNKSSFWDKIINWLKEYGWTIAALLLCHFSFNYFWPKWYNILWDSKVFWIDHLAVPIFLFLGKRDKKGIGTVLLWILIAGNIYNIFQWWREPGSNPSNTSLPPSITPTIPWKPVLLPQGDQAGKDLETVRKFWKEHLPEAEAEEMVIICRNESGGCNQFDKSGEVKTGINKNGTKDIGAMQINDYWWPKEVTQEIRRGNEDIGSYDTETLEGNLLAALHLRNKYGLAPWSNPSYFDGEEADLSVKTITAPKDKLSAAIPTPRGFRLKYDRDDAVVLLKLLPSGKEVIDRHGLPITIDQPEFIRVRTLSESPVNVSIIFK